MSNKEFYQETFSQVHSRVPIRWEDYAHMKRHRHAARRLVMLAAVLAVLAALSAAAVAANLLGLRELLLPKVTVDVMDGDGVAVPGESRAVDRIGLSGWLDSPEGRAQAEWDAFLAGYDRDGAILAAIGNEIDWDLLEAYPCYPAVYTWEMGEKLEEIAGKYGLTLHTRRQAVDSRSDWIGMAGGDFLGDNVPAPGWMYEDGTFHFDGEGWVDGHGLMDYQFDRIVKGSLNDVGLTIGDVDDYGQWSHTASSGVTVTLVLGPDKGLILADLEDSFVTVNVLEGTDQGLTAADMEAFADSFRFDRLTPALPLS